jgi:hypothetical protein
VFRLRHSVVLVCLGGLGPLPARAQDLSALPDVPLSLEGCPEDWTSRLRDQLRIEIDALGKERPAAEHAALERVIVHCQDSRVRIQVRMLSGAKNETELDSGRVQSDALVRTVALSAAELVGALWFDIVPRLPEPPSRNAEDRPNRRPARPAPLFWLGGSARRAGSPGTWLAGGALGLELPVSRILVPLLDLRAECGLARPTAAPVAVEAWSLGAHLLVALPTGPLRVGVGPGLRVGWVVLSGEPAPASELDGHRVEGVFAGPALVGRVGYSLSAPFPWVGLAVDGGLITRRVTGRVDAGPALFEFGGAWAGLTLCLGLSG